MLDPREEQLQKDFRLYKRSQVARPLRLGYAVNMMELFNNGKTFGEDEAGFFSVTSHYRELIPINSPVPRSSKKLVRSDVFTFSLNQQFSVVMDECAKPRRGDSHVWIGAGLKRHLMDLHTCQDAHSLEVYDDSQ